MADFLASPEEKPSARVYVPPSARPFPERLEPPQYPDSMTIRWTDPLGQFSWCSRSFGIAKSLAKEPVGIKQIGPAEWEVHYGPVLLGVVDRQQNVPRFKRTGGTGRRGRPPRL